jgi:large subunit ribosomal protein L29
MATKSKTKEFREKADDALQAELTEKQKHLFDLRSQAVTEKLEDPSQLGKARKEIARIKTILRQRQIEQAKSTNKAAAKA